MKRTDRVEIGAGVPGLALLALAVLIAVGAGMLLDPPIGWLIVIAVAAVLGAALPHLGGLWVAAGAIVVVLAIEPAHPWRTAVAIAAVHLLHVLASLLMVIPPRARVALRALRPTGIRFIVFQAAGQLAALAVAGIAGAGQLPFAMIAGATAVLAIAGVGVGMLRIRRQRYFSPPDAKR
ncbi:hypothetical protein WDU99_00700 [Microbacterium sp. Mu-80]|uniref:Uncharacterized protein n=1 Tax=Microbacterium bandirmense TaxID=3122050 RepID=A0ABU8L693_9MICO